MSAVIQSMDFIATDPKIRNGRPYILGTTITVADIAIAKVYKMLDVDEIAVEYNLTLSQVYSSLAYYYDHKLEIDKSIEERYQLAKTMKEKRVGSRHQPLFR